MRKALPLLAAFLVLVSCSSGPRYDPQDLAAYPVEKTPYGYRIGKGGETGGFIFYPGGFVAPEGYLPIMAKVYAATGYEVFIPKMPFGLAVFKPNAARAIIDGNWGISAWVLSGHSLGGVMASSFAAGNPGAWRALILLASYPDPKKPLGTGRVLSISASEDELSTPEKIAASVKSLPGDARFVEIQGGNHAQFGSYGDQKGDGIALIPRERQQELAVEAIAGFLAE